MSNIIQTLWIGNHLSVMERLSLKSFVDNDMEIHLYCYDEIDNVPEGVVIKDGSEILPKEDIFAYKVGPGKGSYSAFSNFFRYKLLNLKGGWWVDTDMVCLSKWNFEEEYVFITEEDYGTGKSVVNSGAIKAPKGCEIMEWAYQECLKHDREKLQWGTVGPKLLGEAVEKFKLNMYIRERQEFCIIAPFRSSLFTVKLNEMNFPEQVVGLHLWNEAWRRLGLDKHATYHHNSIYERLKRKHKVV